MNITIRLATLDDAAEIVGIYSYYVENTAISFEYQTPSIEEYRGRIAHILERFPFLVAISDQKIVGYAYASPFKTRAAYEYNVETSIYVDQSCHGQGVGRMLYEHLEKILKSQNILNMNACIAYAVSDDGHLTNNSAFFHEHLGFQKIGQFHQCGFKFNSWYDMIWMEKMLGAHSKNPPKFIPFSQLKR